MNAVLGEQDIIKSCFNSDSSQASRLDEGGGDDWLEVFFFFGWVGG